MHHTMKRTASLWIALCGLLVTSLQAQTVKTPPAEKSDPEAKKVLDRVRKKYESYKTFEVAFSFTIEQAEQPKQVQKGVIGQDGDKFKLDMSDQLVIDDTKTTWIYLKKNNEVQITDSEPSNSDLGFFSPRQLLKRYQKGDFLYAISDKISEGSKVITYIEFKPVDRRFEYSKVRIGIDEKTGTIQSIKAFGKNGDRYTFTVNRFYPNKALDANYFKFDSSKFPGVHVEDLRM